LYFHGASICSVGFGNSFLVTQLRKDHPRGVHAGWAFKSHSELVSAPLELVDARWPHENVGSLSPERRTGAVPIAGVPVIGAEFVLEKSTVKRVANPGVDSVTLTNQNCLLCEMERAEANIDGKNDDEYSDDAVND